MPLDLVLCVQPFYPDGFQNIQFSFHTHCPKQRNSVNWFVSVSGLTVESVITENLPPTAVGKIRPGDGLYSIGGVVVYQKSWEFIQLRWSEVQGATSNPWGVHYLVFYQKMEVNKLRFP